LRRERERERDRVIKPCGEILARVSGFACENGERERQREREETGGGG
jgi:hypothetical protein